MLEAYIANALGDSVNEYVRKHSRAALDLAGSAADGEARLRGLVGELESEYPAFSADFIQMLQDGIGDMAGAPSPIEVKIYGDDITTLVLEYLP